jgi:hypothetical protein
MFFYRYEGPFVAGLPEGRGKLTWVSGDVWDGEFKNGVVHGNGTFRTDIPSKLEYQGTFVDGKFEGQGTCR